LDPDLRHRFRHRCFQHVAEAITDTGNGATTDAHPQQLVQQGLDRADARVLIGAQHPQKELSRGTQPLGSTSAGSSPQVVGPQPEQTRRFSPMFDHRRGDRGNLNPLMSDRLGIGTLQMGSAAAAMNRSMLQHQITALDRWQSRSWTRMTSLPIPIKAIGLLAWSRLKSRAFSGRPLR